VNLLNKSHFDFLGLPARFGLDEHQLHETFRRVQAAIHPDRFANAGGAEHRMAMQLATRANEAFGVLRDPGQRAAYLCELNGCPVRAETNTAMSSQFLIQQMQWRESLDDASSRSELSQLDEETSAQQSALLTQLAECLDAGGDKAVASTIVARLMFIGKFRRDLLARLDDEVSA